MGNSAPAAGTGGAAAGGGPAGTTPSVAFCCAGQRGRDPDGPNLKFMQLLTEPKRAVRRDKWCKSQQLVIAEIKHRKHQLALLFRSYDSDDNGVLDLHELAALAQNMEHKKEARSPGKAEEQPSARVSLQILEIMKFLNNGDNEKVLKLNAFQDNMYRCVAGGGAAKVAHAARASRDTSRDASRDASRGRAARPVNPYSTCLRAASSVSCTRPQVAQRQTGSGPCLRLDRRESQNESHLRRE